MRSRSLMMGNERTEESKNEISKRPGAPSPLAKAIIFCFQPLRLLTIATPAANLFPLTDRHLFPPRMQGNPSSTIRSISLADGSMVQEHRQGHHEQLLRKRGSVKVGKPRYLTDYPHMSELLDGLAIFPVLVANQDHAVHRQLGRVQSRQRQQCVIDSPSAAARRQNDGQLELDHHIQHELLLIDGHQHAAQALDDQPIIQQAGRQVDTPQIDFHACPARSQVRRNRRNKLVNFIQRAVCSDSREPHHRYAVGAFERPRLDRLPINRIQSRAKQCGERRFSYARISASNKEMMSHASPADGSPWFCARTFSSADGAWLIEPASMRFPLWRSAWLSAARLGANEKSLFMGPRLHRVISCSSNEGMLPSLCNCFSSPYSGRCRPINVRNRPSFGRSQEQLHPPR